MSVLEIKDLAIFKRNKDANTGFMKAPIVKNVNGVFKSGCLNAIMGPNGCGKTTMLTALYGLTDSTTFTSGEILLDGEKRKEKDWYRRVSLVEQNPYFSAGANVQRVLQFSLDLKNSRANTNTTLSEYDGILESLCLTSLLSTDTSVLSGGEKQRVSIACEIISDKEILILDEPTSDLDSHLALNLIKALKKIAVEQSKMIIFTIHQPSDQIVKQFDTFLFMVSGYTLYSGEFGNLEGYLRENEMIKPQGWTMSDFMFEMFYGSSKFKVISDQKPQIDNFLKKVFGKADSIVSTIKVSSKSSLYVNWCLNISQIWILFKRNIHQVFITRYVYILGILIVLSEGTFGYLKSGFKIPTTTEEFKNNLITVIDTILITNPDNILARFKSYIRDSGLPDLDFTDPNMIIFNKFIGYLSEMYFNRMKNGFKSGIFVFMMGITVLDLDIAKREINLNHYTPLSYIIVTLLVEILKIITLTVPVAIVLFLIGFSGYIMGSSIFHVILDIVGDYLMVLVGIFFGITLAVAIKSVPTSKESLRYLVYLPFYFAQSYYDTIILLNEYFGDGFKTFFDYFVSFTEIFLPHNIFREYIFKKKYNELVEEINTNLPNLSDNDVGSSFSAMIFIFLVMGNNQPITKETAKEFVEHLTRISWVYIKAFNTALSFKSILGKVVGEKYFYPILILAFSILLITILTILTFTYKLSMRVSLNP